MLSTEQISDIQQLVADSIKHKLFITDSELQALMQQCHLSEMQLYPYLLTAIKANAVVPLSNFYVSAIVKCKSGHYYFGINAEFVGTSTSHGIHAEQAAIANAHFHNETAIEAIIVNTNPCGHCRQFIAELINPYDVQIIIPPKAAVSFAELLPNYFGPQDLGLNTGVLTHAGYQFSLKQSIQDELSLKALAAMNHSYAPYWHSPSGIALQMKDTRIFAGSYLENAAVNPSLSALVYALCLLAQAGYNYADIEKVVFIETTNAAIYQKNTVLELLKTIHFQGAFTYYTVR